MQVAQPDCLARRVGPDGDLKDSAGRFAQAYGLKPGSWMFIRPDSYVGAIIEAHETPSLPAYLRQVGLSAAPH